MCPKSQPAHSGPARFRAEPLLDFTSRDVDSTSHYIYPPLTRYRFVMLPGRRPKVVYWSPTMFFHDQRRSTVV